MPSIPPKSMPSLSTLLSKSPRAELTFQIKLLSGKTVVLVDCPGYESELFMPQIVKGRITMQNIMLNRRCCSESSLTTYPLVLRGGAGCVVQPVSSSPLRTSQRGNSSTPLARSTPTALSIRRISGGHKAMELTPEQARFQAIPFEAEIQDFSPHLGMSPSNSSLESPAALLPPRMLSNTDSRSVSGTSTSNVNQIPPLGSPMRKPPPERTYTRRKPNAISKSTPTPTWSPLQKKKRLPAASATKVPNPVMKLEVRNWKLIVDANKSIPAYKVKSDISTPVVKKRIVQKQVTAKTKRQFEALKGTAFDLLTTSAQGTMAKELGKQFQDACMDKRATTVPNYAALSASSPLELDHEVKCLLAKRKRLEHISSNKPKPWMKLT
ncbi:uncharacterized protein LOC117578858 [Drosophila guanche]|uniref:Uncharacterized protein n=1 Tax=Drosophila guanche TaxID=7266 RepID=A0A3B0JNU0_DROGU|nr:uncharacterized protein LOC117578858 [Drosophila guanche]SPP75239.1 Hypothetical predicted protein [Drosophila guanche]